MRPTDPRSTDPAGGATAVPRAPAVVDSTSTHMAAAATPAAAGAAAPPAAPAPAAAAPPTAPP
eukprot:78297-Pyramimonas_sp.AAC.1